jgi:phosphate-selective porin
MVHGHPGLRSINYEVGVFEHDGANARSRDADRVTGGRTLAARVTAQPFRSSKSPLEDLQVGFATTSSDLPTGLAGLRDGTVFGESFLPSNAPVQGARRRLGLEMRWRPGPFSLKSEYMRVTTERLGQSVEDTDLSPLVASGWYVSGTWVLTGEAKARGLDRPRRPLLGGGPGAIEIAARVERLAFGSAAHDDVPSRSPRADVIVGNGDRAITAGVNWYPSRWIKVQFNVIQERLDDPGLGPLPGQSAFWSHVVRLQVTL